jgi:NAD-dependent DNA ligase
MVSRASLHNFHFARKLLLPTKKSGTTTTLDSSVDEEGSIGVKKGISLLVGRAGDVIPQVKKRVFEDDEDDNDIAGLDSNEMISLKDPHVCPACGSPATFVTATTTIKRQKMDISHVAGTDEDVSVEDNGSIDAEVSGQVLRCSGPQLLCPPRAVNGLAYAYSRAGLDVKGLSKAKIGQLMEEGIIRFPVDLFVIYGGTKNEDSSSQHDGRFSEMFDNHLQILCSMGQSHNLNILYFYIKFLAKLWIFLDGENYHLKI